MEVKRRRFKNYRNPKRSFLTALSRRGTVWHACQDVGICRDTVRNWRRDDPEFSRLFDLALETMADRLERTGYQVAMSGDTSMLQFMLRAARPEKFKERYDINIKAEDIDGLIERELARLAASEKTPAPGTAAGPAD